MSRRARRCEDTAAAFQPLLYAVTEALHVRAASNMAHEPEATATAILLAALAIVPLPSPEGS